MGPPCAMEHISTWVPVPELETNCGGWGIGVVACPSLGILATSHVEANEIRIWTLPSLEGALAATAPRRFELLVVGRGFVFWCDSRRDYSGSLAFTGAGGQGSYPRPLLLATDLGHDTVHVLDVLNLGGRVQVGYVDRLEGMPGPRGIAAHDALCAVSCWDQLGAGDHCIRVYQGAGPDWQLVRTIGAASGYGPGQLDMPWGLRFSCDGRTLVVAEARNNRLSKFRVGDGSFVGHYGEVRDRLWNPLGIEQWEGGWLVTSAFMDGIKLVDDADEAAPAQVLFPDKIQECGAPKSMAVVPGLGLVIHDGNVLTVMAGPDAAGMAGMTMARLQWMAVCWRAMSCKGGLVAEGGGA